MLRRSRRPALSVMLSTAVTACGGSRSAVATPDPARVEIVTDDVHRFWRAADDAASASPDLAPRIFQREYLDPGSPGLRDYAALRIRDAGLLAREVSTHAGYYAAIRPATLALDTSATLHDAVQRASARLADLYDGARTPPIYLVVGRLSSGGSISGHGVLIGVELYARDATTPLTELSAWQIDAGGTLDDLPLVIAHEMVHAQQAPARTVRESLLEQSLIEGGADFVAELIAGGHTNRAQHAYGAAHEAALWRAFQRDMLGNDKSAWLYNARTATPSHPADLGYFIGYRICQSYYAHAHDRRAALRDIVLVPDGRKILKESGYDPK